METTRAGSTTARCPCPHLGSIGLSQGLLRGHRQTMKRQPPSCLALRLWALIYSCAAWLPCQEALSHMSKRARLPWAAKDTASHARKVQVTTRTPRPSTKRHDIRFAAGT
jgi:hypothetical protein